MVLAVHTIMSGLTQFSGRRYIEVGDYSYNADSAQ